MQHQQPGRKYACGDFQARPAGWTFAASWQVLLWPGRNASGYFLSAGLFFCYY